MPKKTSWLRRRLTYANIVSSLALFLALGGVSYAATQLPKNSVGSRQIKASAVSLTKISKSARTSLKGQSGAKGTAGTPGAPGSAGPAGATGPIGATGTVDTSAFYTKAQADGRYLQSTVVVVKTIAASIAADSFASTTVSCPANFQAVSGGVDVNGVFFGKVSESAPVFGAGSTRLYSTADGQQGPATGWQGAVTTQGTVTGAGVAKVAVVCSPIG